MASIPIAPLPPSSIRLSVAPEEWDACLDAWLLLCELKLRLPLNDFARAAKSDASLPDFLVSYYHEVSHSDQHDQSLRSAKAQSLQRTCFLLAHRSLLEVDPPFKLLQWEFLTNFSHVHMKSIALSQLIEKLWTRKPAQIEKSLEGVKKSLISVLELSSRSDSEETLKQLAPLLYASSDAGRYFMTGSDLLDAINSAFTSASTGLRQRLTTVAYLGLIALTKGEHANPSLLSDHIYSLKSQAGSAPAASSLLVDLISNTPLLAKLKTLSGKGAERLQKLASSLESLREPSKSKPKRHVKRKIDKGKGHQTQANGELHMHRMSLVTNVQDLFPQLGSGFILRLLDEYDDDVEQVTAHLLEDSLPPHLQSLDRNEEASIFDHRRTEQKEIDHLAPRSTPPLPPQHIPQHIPQRRNVFDGDELDRLELDTSRLHLGKKPDSGDKSAPNKAAILSALAAFDSDDDERDDTYDVEDVGGTVDSAHPDGEPGPRAKVTAEENDAALFTAYKATPELFGRTFDVRRGQARAALKRETGMTDEAIEGWAIMLQRDPSRLRRLQMQSANFDGKQTALAGTAYREAANGTDTEGETGDSDTGNGRGGFGGRGGGRGRGRGRGRGGSVAGPPGDAGTVVAQRRKEANKGSRANHNRRDQRAKKMARGGFPG